MRLRHFAVLLLCAATSPAFAAGGQNLVTDAQRVQELTAGLKEAFDKRDAKGFIAKTEALRRLIDLPPDDFISAARAAAAIKQPLLAKYLYDEYFLRVGASDELFALATTERDAILMEADAELQAERDAAAELTATVGKVVGAHSDPTNPPIRPEYPADLRAARQTGRVELRLYVGRNGRIYEGEIRKSTGNERLDKFALGTALTAWHFVPGTNDGKPVPMWTLFAANFTLDETTPPAEKP